MVNGKIHNNFSMIITISMKLLILQTIAHTLNILNVMMNLLI